MSETFSRTEAQRGAPEWRYVLGRLQLSVAFDDFAAALGFVDAVGAIAEEQDHHPEIALRHGRVHLAVSSHDAGGITERDHRFASAVTAIVADHGGTVEPSRLTEVEIAIDTTDPGLIRPFWKAVLGYVDHPVDEDAIADPDRIGPTVWFQQMDEPRPVRNRIHLDVTVAHDEAAERIRATLAAGGRMVDDTAAPRFWTLADVDGNEACICTWAGRDEYDAALATSG